MGSPMTADLGMAMDEDTWRRSFEIDVMGTVAGVEAAVPNLEKSPAVVVGTTGALEMYDAGYVRLYAAVKTALVLYVKGIARSLAPKGVRANLVSPGNIYFKGGVWNVVESAIPRHLR
jgi:3-oxoacyl-[acyl-carrier protein] reductase